MADTITITWRDENYGSDRRLHAFRSYDWLDLDEARQKEAARLIREAGFETDHRRCCWASDETGAPIRALEALRKAGFQVGQAGCTRH